MQFFAKGGFPCPTRRNPSDHFLHCINSDFDAVTTKIMAPQTRQVYISHHFFFYLSFIEQMYETFTLTMTTS